MENMTLTRVYGADIGLGDHVLGSRGLDSTPLPEGGRMLEIHLSPRIIPTFTKVLTWGLC